MEGQAFDSITDWTCCSGQAPLSHDEEMRDCCSHMIKNTFVAVKQ